MINVIITASIDIGTVIDTPWIAPLVVVGVDRTGAVGTGARTGALVVLPVVVLLSSENGMGSLTSAGAAMGVSVVAVGAATAPTGAVTVGVATGTSPPPSSHDPIVNVVAFAIVFNSKNWNGPGGLVALVP